MGGFSKSKVLDRKGESLVGKISELAKKAETIANADSGGSETARLRRMLTKTQDDLEKANDEMERAVRERAAMKAYLLTAQEELKKAKSAVASVEKDAKKLREMIKRYGELESGLGKAIDKVIGDMQKMDDVNIEIPKDDFFE